MSYSNYPLMSKLESLTRIRGISAIAGKFKSDLEQGRAKESVRSAAETIDADSADVAKEVARLLRGYGELEDADAFRELEFEDD